MEVKIGNHVFEDSKVLASMLRTGMAKEYDLSAKAREKHDDESVFLNGVKIKATQEEIRTYWRVRLSQALKMGRPIQPGEEVVNIWR
jgi:hypothetical protein